MASTGVLMIMDQSHVDEGVRRMSIRVMQCERSD